MKNKKSFILFTLFLLFTVVLVGCGGNKDKKAVAAAKEKLEIGFTAPDTASSVTKDVTLATKDGDVVITWASNDPAITAAGKVTRGTEDKAVKLTATFTLKKVVDTKEFTVTVTKLESTINEEDVAAKAKLIADYADTLGSPSFKATENIELVATVNGRAVTWTVTSNADYLTNKGVVTRPTFTVGDVTAVLKAKIGQEETTFYVTVAALEQTVEEKITVALNRVTVVTAGSTEFQEVNFNTVDKTMIGEEEVLVTWTTSDAEVMTAEGVIVPFAGEPREVTLTASITFEEVTMTKEVLFKIEGLEEFSSLKTALALNGSTVGQRVFVRGVVVYKDHGGGYFLASKDNTIVYVNGGRDKKVIEDDVIYDVIATVDNYYGALQFKDVAVSVSEITEVPVITAEVKTFADIVNVTLPGDDALFLQHPFILENVVVELDDTIADERYKVFLADPSANSGTPDIQRKIMIYYHSNIDIIRGLDGFTIASIELLNAGYRSDKFVWYANFLGSADDITLSLTAEEEVEVAEKQVVAGFKANYFANAKLNLVATSGKTNVVWTSSHPELIDLNGNVVVPTTGNQEVTLTATITSTEDAEITAVVTFKTLVGQPDAATITELIDAEKGTVVTLEDVLVTGISANGTYTAEDASGKAIAIYAMRNVSFEIGFKYTIIVSKDEYNGLHQGRQEAEAVKGAAGTAVVVDLNEVDLTKLEAFQSHLINLDNMLVTAHDVDERYGNVEMTLVRISDNKEIKFKWDSRVEVTDPVVATLKDGDVVNLVAAPLGWSKGALVGFNVNSQVVLVDPANYEDAVKLNLDAREVTLVTKFEAAGALVLQETLTMETTIEWSFKDSENANNALVDLATGAVTLPATGQVKVTVVATLTNGTATKALEFELVIGVAVVGETETVTTTPKNTADLKLEDGVDAAASLDLDAELFSVTAEMGTGTSPLLLHANGVLRIYGERNSGNGNTLVISVAEGHKITGVKFTFGKAGNLPNAAKFTAGEFTKVYAEADIVDTTLTISDLDASSFSLQNTHLGGNKNGQLWMTQIEITYTK